jgi:hypothetical protein
MSPIEEQIVNANYKYANTMPKFPHYYTVRTEWENQDDFIACVNYIRENGVTESYFKAKFIYLYIGEYKYWTMNGYDKYNLINRAVNDKTNINV